jgi:YD repeat-containing protein
MIRPEQWMEIKDLHRQGLSQRQLSAISRGAATLAAYTYDSVGRVRTATDAAGVSTTYEYNNLDAVTRVTYADGSYEEREYVCCGVPGVVRDRSGRKSYYDYDPLKRLRWELTRPGASATATRKRPTSCRARCPARRMWALT